MARKQRESDRQKALRTVAEARTLLSLLWKSKRNSEIDQIIDRYRQTLDTSSNSSFQEDPIPAMNITEKRELIIKLKVYLSRYRPYFQQKNIN